MVVFPNDAIPFLLCGQNEEKDAFQYSTKYRTLSLLIYARHIVSACYAADLVPARLHINLVTILHSTAV